MTKTPPPVVVKNVKHTFTNDELNQIGADLARSIGQLRGIEAELDQVKASFKAKVTECEARINSLSTDRVNGFDMRNERCIVLFRPNDRKKDFFLESDAAMLDEAHHGLTPMLIEDMTREDFQFELLQAESVFDHREEIQLFPPADLDFGTLVVGEFGQKWFGALRIRIGKLELTERLDSEQKAFKNRADAVAMSVKRVKQWAKDNLKDLSKGFTDQFDAVVEEHKERAE
jgi:hypothetical protein